MMIETTRRRHPIRSAPAWLAGFALALVASCGPGAKSGIREVGDVEVAPYRTLVEALASDAMEGRGVRTAGNRLATELLAKELRAVGLKPGAPDGTYLQCFEHPVSVRAETASLEVAGSALPAEAFAPTAFSESADFAGDLVFVGYGIHAPDAGYDDYAGVEVTGKVVVVMRYEPREKDPDSPLNGDKPSRFSDLRRKSFEAKSRGATAILFVVAPRAGDEPDKHVPALAGAEAASASGIPVLHVLPAVVDGWLAAAGTSLADQVAAIDADFASKPLPLGSVRGSVRLARELKELCNVLGVLPGSGALADETLVIGAHFDHLGFGESGTMSPGDKAVHNGADDNASGAAGLVSLARALSDRADGGSRRTILFAAFNGEEVGLAGSSAYVDDPTFPLDRTNAMLNMDMIGRMKDNTLVVLGTATSDRWMDWLGAEAEKRGLTLSTHGDGYGPSDQTAFYSRGVPVLHFFTGAHDDYHKPSDDSDKINYDGAAKVLGVVAGLARRAAVEPIALVYKETTAGPAMAGDSRGYGAWLGTVPDYTAMSPGASGGVLLGGVRKGGPAEAAGIKGGDRIVKMAGRAIDNLYDMTFVLRDHRPGDVIEVVVLRGEESMTLAIALMSRAEMGGAATGDAHGKGPHDGGAHGDGAAHGGSPEKGSPHAGPHGAPGEAGPPMDPETLLYPGEEKFLRNVRMLTTEGENAEAYWSPDGKHLVFQARGGEVACDRIYTMEVATGKIEEVSSGEGRTTCAYYTWPKGKEILYASTHLGAKECPPPVDHSKGYVWALYDSYDIFLRRPGKKLMRLTRTPGYDAEATVCMADGRVLFTSVRDGDLDLYVMDRPHPKAKVTRLTDTPGYDGGAFFSPDCSRIVWRTSRPTGAALEEYRALLAEGMVRPSKMEIWVANSDGSEPIQVTSNGAANFAPYFLPDNRRVIFASNVGDPTGRNFDLYMIDPYADEPAATLTRITHSPVFEAFPMFSPDGRLVVFASNRNARTPGDTNLFLAEWIVE